MGWVSKYHSVSTLYAGHGGKCGNNDLISEKLRIRATLVGSPVRSTHFSTRNSGCSWQLHRLSSGSSFDTRVQLTWPRRLVPARGSPPPPAWWNDWLFGPPEEAEEGPEEPRGIGGNNWRGPWTPPPESPFPPSDFADEKLTPRERSELIGGAVDDVDAMIEDPTLFEAWRIRREAKQEIRDLRDEGIDPDSDSWEDWLDESERIEADLGGWYEQQPEWEKGGMPRSAPKIPGRGMSYSFKELIQRIFERESEVEAELSFEERIFRFTSQSTAKFVTCLLLVPWLTGLAMHDLALVPFTTRWVETTPLAARMLDVREKQKLEMVQVLKLERQRVKFEAEIGKVARMTGDEMAEHMAEEARELRDDIRAENRSAFSNIWSDALAGMTGFAICVFNPKQVAHWPCKTVCRMEAEGWRSDGGGTGEQVAIMRMTGDRIFTNISDTGKAFIIILCTDIFLGYHSESGWETVIEMFLDHYGFEAEQASIYIFVATVPVTLDVCFKLWVFRYLSRLSPSAAATFREMKRH